jgi:hypothetical protein
MNDLMSGGMHRFLLTTLPAYHVTHPAPQVVEGLLRVHSGPSARQCVSRRCWRHRRHFISHSRCVLPQIRISRCSSRAPRQALKAAGAENSGRPSRVVLSDINNSMSDIHSSSRLAAPLTPHTWSYSIPSPYATLQARRRPPPCAGSRSHVWLFPNALIRHACTSTPIPCCCTVPHAPSRLLSQQQHDTHDI